MIPYCTQQWQLPLPSNSSNMSSSSSFKQETLVELHHQKRELKQELEKYDTNFFDRHGRMPVKAGKELIRHLYEKYNQLNNRITVQ